MAKRGKLLIGNWKMHGRAADLAQVRRLNSALGAYARAGVFALCPPALWIREAARLCGEGPLQIGAQDCSPHEDGAHTGEHSAAMLAEAGARWVLIGHSERRAAQGETDALVAAKARAAAAAGLRPVVCVGETAAQRQSGDAEAVVQAQVRAALPHAGEAVVAYEPVWCIGGEETPGVAEIARMHAAIHALCANLGAAHTPVVYGGSVKPGNAATLLGAAGVDGLLLGRASLACDSFLAIAQAL